jgi:hypothetical protein
VRLQRARQRGEDRLAADAEALGRLVPECPSGVVVVTATGERVPVEVVFHGWQDGLAYWEVTQRFGVPPQGVEVEVLPARTGIVVTTVGGEPVYGDEWRPGPPQHG